MLNLDEWKAALIFLHIKETKDSHTMVSPVKYMEELKSNDRMDFLEMLGW